MIRTKSTLCIEHRGNDNGSDAHNDINLTIKEGISARLYVCECLLCISTTIYPIDFTIGGCIAGNPRKCSVEREVWMRGSREIYENIS